MDELVIAGDEKSVNWVMFKIKERFKCTVTEFDEDRKKNILGIDIKINPDSIELCQDKYIEKLGIRFNIEAKHCYYYYYQSLHTHYDFSCSDREFWLLHNQFILS